MRNKVYLVGAGPGDPGLITVRGLGILRQADVVIYDYLVDKRLLDEAKEDAELICCDKPPHQLAKKNIDNANWCGGKLGKKRYSDGFSIHNEKINELVVKKVREGKKVIRLKNGDPGIFSRTSQELEALVKNKIEFEIVPGVPAANAASCLSGIPLTDRRFASSCVFVTAHEDPTKKGSYLDWTALAKSGTVVLYMAVENLDKIVKELLNVGRHPDTPVAIIQDVSLLTQKVLTATLKDIVKKAKETKIKPPAIIVIGEVVKLEKEFNWLKKSKRILFTGLSQERFFEKGTYFHLPLIKIEPLKDYREFDGYLKNIREFDWVVFSSRYGVQYFFQRLNKIGLDVRILEKLKIAAIGNSTRMRLLDFGVLADLVPKKECSRGLLEEFKNFDIKNKKIFLPRSNLSDKGLTKGLNLQGANVTACVVYKNLMPEGLPELNLEFFDEIMFTSPSGVRNFVKRYKTLPKKVKVRCIGDVTFKETKKFGLIVDSV